MEENWDDDNFVPQEIKIPVVKGPNKWEGEDEDEDQNLKESWEDEEEEKDKSDKSDEKPQIIQKPKKKSFLEKIAEKERLKREEMERKMKEEEDELSPEERLRRQKMSDLKLALETTFVGSKEGGGGENAADLGIDGMCPESREDFDEFANTLMKKIQPLVKSTEYPNFAENLVRSICATLTSFDLKKVKTTIDNLYLEKQKIEKGDKTKKNKGKGKVKLKVEQDNNQYSAYAVDNYDDFNDFM